MQAFQFITNESGERTGLVLDFTDFRTKTQKECNQYLEDLEDLIICEFRKNDKKISWQKAQEKLRANGVID